MFKIRVLTNNIKEYINYTLFSVNFIDYSLFLSIMKFMGIQSEAALLEAYTFIEAGNIPQAKSLLEEALTANLDDTNLVFAVYCCSFWSDTIVNLDQQAPLERGEILINQWKQFCRNVIKTENPSERTLYSFQKGIFSMALESFANADDERNANLQAEISRKQGLCYKKLGSYETALNCLTKANSLIQGSAPILAEMADCYALCGETKLSKVLFRESFFIDPEKIDLDFLDSPLIRLLIEQVSSKGYTGSQLQEWIPVYGVLLGVFNIKRELRSREVGHLKQEIYAMENQLKDPANDASLLTPRLLNMYFWLIDHYVLSKDNVSKINEVLLKIKILDPAVHKIYIK